MTVWPAVLGCVFLLAAASAPVGPHAPVAAPGAAPVATAATPQTSVPGYAPPVAPLQVVRGFDRPDSPYGPGHRGVDIAVRPDEPVHAPADGTVNFAGQVAGRGVVVLLHPDGVRTEYEPITPAVRTGQTVAAGSALGTVHGAHGDCPVDGCLHWGARDARGEYFDPVTLLRPLGPVRLLPW